MTPGLKDLTNLVSRPVGVASKLLNKPHSKPCSSSKVASLSLLLCLSILPGKCCSSLIRVQRSLLCKISSEKRFRLQAGTHWGR